MKGVDQPRRFGMLGRLAEQELARANRARMASRKRLGRVVEREASVLLHLHGSCDETVPLDARGAGLALARDEERLARARQEVLLEAETLRGTEMKLREVVRRQVVLRRVRRCLFT